MHSALNSPYRTAHCNVFCQNYCMNGCIEQSTKSKWDFTVTPGKRNGIRVRRVDRYPYTFTLTIYTYPTSFVRTVRVLFTHILLKTFTFTFTLFPSPRYESCLPVHLIGHCKKVYVPTSLVVFHIFCVIIWMKHWSHTVDDVVPHTSTVECKNCTYSIL